MSAVNAVSPEGRSVTVIQKKEMVLFEKCLTTEKRSMTARARGKPFYDAHIDIALLYNSIDSQFKLMSIALGYRNKCRNILTRYFNFRVKQGNVNMIM